MYLNVSVIRVDGSKSSPAKADWARNAAPQRSLEIAATKQVWRRRVRFAILSLILGLVIGYIIAPRIQEQTIEAQQTCLAKFISSERSFASKPGLLKPTTLTRAAYLAAIDDMARRSLPFSIPDMYNCTIRTESSPMGMNVETLLVSDVPYAFVRMQYGQAKPEWHLERLSMHLGEQAPYPH